MSVKIDQFSIYRTAIPMRSFEHAAAARAVAEAILVRLQFSDGSAGWGETLPRPYVTGETLETVAADLADVIWPACRDLDFGDPASFSVIPTRHNGRCINAAACAFELAAAPLIPPGQFAARRIDARVSGVLGSSDPAKTVRRLRLMRWFGLRDFKLKLGFAPEVDAENLRLVHARLAKGIAAGKLTLRVDVNGGWDAASTPQRVSALRSYGVCVVEQPTYCPAAQLAELASRCELPLMADESLLTLDDARQLMGKNLWWNIRLSKNGGLLNSAALARLAVEKNIPFVVGAMVGESGLLSAAQRRLLQMCGGARFVEGNYGRFLLGDDLTDRSLHFGYGGRLAILRGPGLGVEVRADKFRRYATPLRTFIA